MVACAVKLIPDAQYGGFHRDGEEGVPPLSPGVGGRHSSPEVSWWGQQSRLSVRIPGVRAPATCDRHHTESQLSSHLLTKLHHSEQ